MEDFIDFADITNQIYRSEMDEENQFNLMIVGPTGIGKSTLVKSLFKGMIKPAENDGEPKLNEYVDLLEECGVKLKLRCIETSNFDTHKCEVYTNYIDGKFEDYFVAQCRQSHWQIDDTRVHSCLYMIQPYGKIRLREEDIKCMRALHERVNLIPIIAKADSFNASQLAKFKENILADLESNGISYYKFNFDDKEDEDRSRVVEQLAKRFPFAVVAADEPTLVGKKYCWIRETISGHIDIRNENYDFDALANLLIRHCMLNMIDSTHTKHYAKFKKELLSQAARQEYKNLVAMGLEPWEIPRIKHTFNPTVKGVSYREFRRQRRAVMEKELDDLKEELLTLKSALAAKKHNADTPREKPAVPPKYLRH